MRKHLVAAGAAAAAGLGIMACDQGTAPKPVVRPALVPNDPFRLAGVRKAAVNERSPYGCDLFYRDASSPGTNYSRLNVGVKHSQEAAHGARLKYSLRVVDGDKVMASALCTMPNTPQAIAFLSRVIGHNAPTTGASVNVAGSALANFASAPGGIANDYNDIYGLPTMYIVATWIYWGTSGGGGFTCDDAYAAQQGCYDHSNYQNGAL